MISDGRLVGIISRSDLLRALTKVEKPSAPSTQDAQIQEAVDAEMAKQGWSRIRCQVRNGVAELSGTIFDERERLAAKVAAENVPGVRAITDHLTWIDPY